MSLSCWMWQRWGAAPGRGPAPSVSRAWHSGGLPGGGCGPPATAPVRWCPVLPAPLAPAPRQGNLAHLRLLLGMQLLPEGLHARGEPQEAGGALLEELLVVGLHRPLQPRLLPPPLQHKAQPRCPHLREGR